MTYSATIRHHSISRARSIEGTSLTEVKRRATKEFGDGFLHHEIVIRDEADDIVARRLIRNPRWS